MKQSTVIADRRVLEIEKIGRVQESVTDGRTDKQTDRIVFIAVLNRTYFHCINLI